MSVWNLGVHLTEKLKINMQRLLTDDYKSELERINPTIWNVIDSIKIMQRGKT